VLEADLKANKQKLKEAVAASKSLESASDQSLAGTRRELEEARQSTQRYAADLAATQTQLVDSVADAQGYALELEAMNQRITYLKAEPGRCCPPRHSKRFEPSFLDLNGTL